MVWQREDKYLFDTFLEKHKSILVFFAVLFALISLRIFYLQIIKGNYYRKVSEQQRLYSTRELAPRGIIYDENGVVLAGNEFSYCAQFEPFRQNEEPSEETLAKLGKILKIDISSSVDRSYKKSRVIKFADNLTKEQMFKIQERKLELEGISVVKEPRRVYYYPKETSHVLGYVSEITQDELESMSDDGFKGGDFIGRGGVEQQYDSYLRGRNGGWQLEVNSRGYQTRAFEYVPIEIGASVYTTIDIKLQTAAYEALKNSPTGRGAAVVIDTRNGAILAFVSTPGFDANKIGTPDFLQFINDKKLPFFNRALQANYPAGSTFKIITLAAGLELLDLDPYATEYCSGYFELGDRKYKCWLHTGHGTVNMFTAVAQSCNVYFYKLGLRLGVKNIIDFARKFYFGERTGIDLPNEKEGFIPTPEWKKSRTKMPWLQGDTVILAVGQGALIVTPLQLTDMICAVANKGTYFKPHVVDKIVDPRTGEVLYKYIIKTKMPIELSDKSWDLLHKVLIGTVESGTGQRTKLSGIKVAGKTGTAQNPHGEDHAWFVSFAPADKPEIAIAVIVENGGGGGTNAVPVARKIYEAYFGLAPAKSGEAKK